jgi:hypothetical protein
VKLRDHAHGVTFTNDDGLDIHVTMLAEANGNQYLCVSTPHRRVDMRISPKGRSIKHWLVKSPMTPGVMARYSTEVE